MFELGTEVFLAFCTASTSVGLPDRSAPPIFAATSMFLMSLAKDFARRWSLIAFWCLVVAHLEWPDIGPLGARNFLAQSRSGAKLDPGATQLEVGQRGDHRWIIAPP